MVAVSRLFAPAVLAAGLGMVAFSPAAVQAQSAGNDLIRVLVDVADVVFRSGTPYYRQGDYGRDDRLIVGRDQYGRSQYYRQMPRQYNDDYLRDGGRFARNQDVKCNKHGKCKVKYYDPRNDRNHERDHDDDHRREHEDEGDDD